jgi:hypothetical protein
MRLHRVLLPIGLGAVLFVLVVDGAAAGADCSGPMIEYAAGPVDRGQDIIVTGRGFGDSCYDTGPPPPGQGAMGRPLDDIDVITQVGVDHLVAEGTADAEYGFEVDVVVPAELEPGEARLQVRWGDGTAWASDRTDQTLVVSQAPSSAGGDVVATFGPEAAAPAEAAARPEPDGSSDVGPWVGGAVVVLCVVAGGSMLVVRRR